MLKKVSLLMLVVIMIITVPLNSFANSADHTVSADEAAMMLQEIFNKYGDGNYQVADIDENKTFDKKEINQFLKEVEKELIKEKLQKIQKEIQKIGLLFDESTSNLIVPRVPWVYKKSTEYTSGTDNISIFGHGTGVVSASWKFDIVLCRPADVPNWALVSCDNPYDINTGYSGIGEVKSLTVTSSVSYLYNPHPVRGFFNVCSYVQGKVQIFVNALIPFTTTKDWLVQKTFRV